MDTALICNWNELVKPGDIVFHLGDFSFQSDKFREKLNGVIHLIRGNHDKSKYDYLFDEVVDYAELQVGEYNCILTHIPILREYKDLKKNCAVLDVDIMKDYSFNLCGHVHEKWTVYNNSINVGVDVWNYRPIHIGRLANFLRMLKKGY